MVAEVVENLELFNVLADFLEIGRVSSLVGGHMGGVQDVFTDRLSPFDMADETESSYSNLLH